MIILGPSVGTRAMITIQQLLGGIKAGLSAFVSLRWLYGTIGVLLLIANCVLLYENRLLTRLVDRSSEALSAPIGSTLPLLEGTSNSGRNITIRYGQGEKATLLFAFSESCPICDRTWPAWNSILAATKGTGVRPVFVDLTGESDRRYIAQHNLSAYPLIKHLNPTIESIYNLRFTPTTMLLSSDGHVIRAWTGSLDKSSALDFIAVYLKLLRL
jgi:hypothetical protein